MTIPTSRQGFFILGSLTSEERAALEDVIREQQYKIPPSDGQQNNAAKALHSILFQFRVAMTASKQIISFADVKQGFLLAISQGSGYYVSERELSQAIFRLEQAWLICIRFLQRQLLMLRAGVPVIDKQ